MRRPAGCVAITGLSDGASCALSLGPANVGLLGHALAFPPGFLATTRFADAPKVFVTHEREDPALPIERRGRRIAATLERAGCDLDPGSPRWPPRPLRYGRGGPRGLSR